MVVDGRLLGKDQPEKVGDGWDVPANWLGTTQFEAKALYVVGLMRHLAEGAMRCVRVFSEPGEPYVQGAMELPAYVLVADATEALGRCLHGCPCEDFCKCTDGRDTSGKDKGIRGANRLRNGLEHLAAPDLDFQGTRASKYDVPACIGLRNFTTHGGTTGSGRLDRELTCTLLDRLGTSLTEYWESLKAAGDRRDKLAKALIHPLRAGGVGTVFIEDMYANIVTNQRAAGAGIGRPAKWASVTTTRGPN